YTMTRAFAAAPVAVTQPATFLQLVWAVLAGWVIFGETIDVWVVIGGTIVLMAVSFIAWREYVLNRRAVTPVTHATKV
ncbi:MAG: EamA family transporter, partial [Pseudomonadota bacterium]